MNRRRTDRSDIPQRRREDELEQVVDASQRRNKLLTELLEHGSRNFRRYRRRNMIAWAVLTIAATAGVFWVLSIANQASEAAAKANLAAAQAKALTREVQAQRRDSIRSNCEGQNRRHDAAIRALDILIAKAPPARRERAKAGRDGTVFLIQALQPRQNCAALVARSAPTP